MSAYALVTHHPVTLWNRHISLWKNLYGHGQNSLGMAGTQLEIRFWKIAIFSYSWKEKALQKLKEINGYLGPPLSAFVPIFCGTLGNQALSFLPFSLENTNFPCPRGKYFSWSRVALLRLWFCLIFIVKQNPFFCHLCWWWWWRRSSSFATSLAYFAICCYQLLFTPRTMVFFFFSCSF